MQIKFLTMYHKLKDEEYNSLQAQYELLSMWQRSITQRNIKFIKKAKIMFQTYSFSEYLDQEKLIKELQTAYSHKDKRTGIIEYWWGGKQYPDFDTLFKALAKQKRLMELTIEVDE
jgi:hypothetical protein